MWLSDWMCEGYVIGCARVIEVMVLKDDDRCCWWCEGCGG